ncbi:hypothetical protein HYH96_12495 [Clostridium botulinum]|uniref:hypothetical protein n=1 Tax=Clostridium botulinum TaxID=1491 RepID=UPI000D0E143C|nr:hypothetical protein [Clostridium botulinum]MBD5644703.1 hypothetical protein [Clostridium botulinum]PSL98679.1 hypothetical protein C6C12_13755 [Clostridium botulinum]HDK7138025.1 hypothetical protein [Clostridium botulinum]HDK7186446.1 hypothetical protein [Clostridium botulinum]HDK7192972.1 hypothetical protein [Clostridium botulinum]
MPVAANVNRLDKIKVDLCDVDKYSCDVSFLSTSGINNEFNKYMAGFLKESTVKDINDLFNKQNLNKNQFTLKDVIDFYSINNIEKETGYVLKTEAFLKEKLKWLFYLVKNLMK